MFGRWIMGSTLRRIEGKVDRILDIIEKERTVMSKMDDAIAKLQGDVANLTTVDQSAITLINGIKGQIDAAVQAAQAAGATPAQLQSMSDLSTALEAQSTNLAGAVAANTPAPPPGP